MRSIAALRAVRDRAEAAKRCTAAKSGATSTGCPTRTSRCCPCRARSNIAAALVGVFDSQVTGGKRYDLATAGRRLAHATYYASHGTDQESAMNFAMDLTPLVEDPRSRSRITCSRLRGPLPRRRRPPRQLGELKSAILCPTNYLRRRRTAHTTLESRRFFRLRIVPSRATVTALSSIKSEAW